MNPAAIPRALTVLPPPAADGHDLQLRVAVPGQAGRAGAQWVGCTCRPGVWLALAQHVRDVDRVGEAWARYEHRKIGGQS